MRRPWPRCRPLHAPGCGRPGTARLPRANRVEATAGYSPAAAPQSLRWPSPCSCSLARHRSLTPRPWPRCPRLTTPTPPWRPWTKTLIFTSGWRPTTTRCRLRSNDHAFPDFLPPPAPGTGTAGPAAGVVADSRRAADADAAVAAAPGLGTTDARPARATDRTDPRALEQRTRAAPAHARARAALEADDA